MCKINKQYELILAMNELGYIGIENKLPWNCPADLKHFKEITTGGIVVMGANTFRSMNCNPLKNRITIVLTSDKNQWITQLSGHPFVILAESFDEIDKIIDSIHTTEPERKVFVVGGVSVFNHYLTECRISTSHISVIDDNIIGDTYISFGDILTEMRCDYSDDIEIQYKEGFTYYKINFGGK